MRADPDGRAGQAGQADPWDPEGGLDYRLCRHRPSDLCNLETTAIWQMGTIWKSHQSGNEKRDAEMSIWNCVQSGANDGNLEFEPIWRIDIKKGIWN